MNEHTLRVLEYDKIKNIVAGYAASGPGKELVLGLEPSTDRGVVARRLQETGEFIRVLQHGEAPPLDNIPDIRPALEKVGPAGSMLLPVELLNIAALLSAGRRVKSFFQRLDTRLAAPLLGAKAARIRPLMQIEDAVRKVIDENAEVKDSASAALRRVRKQLGRTRDEILERMTGILQDSSFQKVLQEPVITLRDDRYVLPLKPNFRQSLKGVVHGQSSSRATLFVEPLDVLEQNNRLSELRMEEREELERILRELTALVAQEAVAIEETAGALAEIDAVFGRARFGLEYNAAVPELSADNGLRLLAARHPLLVWRGKTGPGGIAVAPNDVVLNTASRVLIISGPNAGGKTAILKTVGLLCLMAQSGLPVTAAEDSAVPVFGALFADIGDEQSLEQDVSTFSSHVSQIAGILKHADRASLVLLDEIGSGTDPAEGAALGAAVLSSLIARGCMAVVTTHHGSLKLFGSQTSGALNAAMEFDSRTLAPTYRFIPGRPGRSYGLDMAERLGVPDDVIQDARARMGEDQVGLDRLLEQIENDARVLRQEKEHLGQGLIALQKAKAEAESLLMAARDEARASKVKAKQEAREVLSTLRRKLKELSSISTTDRQAVQEETTEVESLARRLEPGPEDRPLPLMPGHEFQPGERVRIPRLKKTGAVRTAHKGVLEVEADGITLKLSANEVVLAKVPREPSGTALMPGWSADLREDEGLPDRLNIIGLRVDDALAELDSFIDRATASGLSSVLIIHGLGTGALKTAVAAYLKGHPLIAAMRSGEPAEGGAGVTKADLKK